MLCKQRVMVLRRKTVRCMTVKEGDKKNANNVITTEMHDCGMASS